MHIIRDSSSGARNRLERNRSQHLQETPLLEVTSGMLSTCAWCLDVGIIVCVSSLSIMYVDLCTGEHAPVCVQKLEDFRCRIHPFPPYSSVAGFLS